VATGCFEAYLPDHNCHSYEEHGYHCKGDWCAADAAEVSGDISICAKKAEEGTVPVEHYEGFRCGHCHCVPGNDGGHGDTCTFGKHDKPWCYVNADCPGATTGSFGVWSEEPCSGYTTTTTTTTMAPTTTTTTARPTTTTVAPIHLCAGEGAYGTICPLGSEIRTLEDCRVAVEQMHPGVEISEWVGDYDQIPRYCSFRESDGYLHFNPGAAGEARKDLAPLCKPVLGNYGDVCPDGGDIETEEECRVAVGQLNFDGEIQEWIGDYDQIPQRCSFRESDGCLHFNPGAAGKGRKDLAPLCKIISAPKILSPKCTDPNFISQDKVGSFPVKVSYGNVQGPSGMPFEVHGQFKASPDTPKWSGIVDHVADGNHKNYAGWKIGLDEKHSLRLDVSQSTSYYARAHSSQQHLADGKWHTFVCKVTKDYIQIEVDGVLGQQAGTSDRRGKQTPPELGRVVNTNDYIVGQDMYSNERLFQGEIKDLYLCGGEAQAPAPPPAPLTDPSGCPVCTCNSPSWWHPFNGCNIRCGAKCGNQCCCIPGVGACPR